MKKLFLVTFILTLFVNLSAQEEESESAFKPNGGFVLGVNFTPFNGGNMVSIDQLQGRYFINSDLAIRAGVGLRLTNDKTENGVVAPANFESTTSTTLISFAVGAEKHFFGTNRLSPYVGAEFNIALFNSKYEETAGTVTTKHEGSTDGLGTNRKYTQLGFDIVAGADYYISKHLYLGLEIGLGFYNRTNGEMSTTTGGTTVSSTDKSKSFVVSHNWNPALKLGFKF